MLRLARLPRTVVGIPGLHLDARKVVTATFSARCAVSSVRQVHHSHARLTSIRKQILKIAPRASSTSVYIRGPTLPALKLVVRALKEGPSQMGTKELWELIHREYTGDEYSYSPKNGATLPTSSGKYEPEHPNHYVRSIKYLKAVLLKTLEADGRIQKVKIQKETAEGQTEMAAKPEDNWVWELVPPKEGVTPIEERNSIPVRELDRLWLGADTDGTVDAQSWTVTGGNEGTNRNGWSRRQSGLAEMSEEERKADQVYGQKLTAKWRELTKTSRRRPARHPENSRPVDWKDPEMEEARKKRRKDMEATRLVWPSKDTAGGLVPVKDGNAQQSTTTEEKKNPKPWLNANEPEYRQSRFGRNDIALALKDPRRRQYGFNYGLPKQKELLRAANARDPRWDQKEWSYQPPHDISHLNTRRQRGRERQNVELTGQFKRASRLAHEARTGSNSVKIPVIGDTGKGRWGSAKQV